jgi:hypothetical protein
MTSNLDPKDLIQAEIDGVATLEESGALNAWAERDSSVRDQLREMRKLADLLADVERVAPPPGLASGVMRAIRASNDSRARTPLARPCVTALAARRRATTTPHAILTPARRQILLLSST